MNVESWQQKEEEEEEKERERKGDEGVTRCKRGKGSSFFFSCTPLNEEIRSSKESHCREQVVIEPLTSRLTRLPHTDTHVHMHTHTHFFGDKHCQEGLKLNFGINQRGFDSFTALPGAPFGTAA